MTKDPTDETVYVNGECQFIARYENADLAEWHFVSPDGSLDVSYAVVQSYLPELRIIGGSSKDLTLQNIPEALNGCRVYCCFTNSAGSVNTKPALITVISGQGYTYPAAQRTGFEGRWTDEISGRCQIIFTYRSEGSMNVDINWSGSAWVHGRWQMTANAYNGNIMGYADGHSWIETYYSESTYSVSDEQYGFSLKVEGEGKDSFHASGRNMAFASFLSLWNKLTDHRRIGLDVQMKNQVPKSRGLGSSSTAIVAGVTAASILSGANLTQDEILQEANKLEGHPDNVAPAIYGGFTISFQENGVAHTLRTIPKMPLQFIAVVPDMQLSTHLAREAIPKVINHPDAVFNASRTALLTAALLEDYQCIISGSGSTLLAYASPEKDGDAIGKAMVGAFASCGQTAVYHILQLNTKGTEVLHVEL